jgi:hypothetical protein
MAIHNYNLSSSKSSGKRIMICGYPEQKHKTISKTHWGMASGSRREEALSSNPNTAKKKKKRKKKLWANEKLHN